MAHGELPHSPTELCLQGQPAMPAHAELLSTDTNPTLHEFPSVNPSGSTPWPRPRRGWVDHPVIQRGGCLVVLLSPAEHHSSAGLAVGTCSGLTDPPRANTTHALEGEKYPQNKSEGKGQWKKDEDAEINPTRHSGG